MASEMVWKAAATLASIGAGLAARNVATSVWRRTKGGDPPANPADPATGWGEAVLWTVAVGALVGVARLLARRGTAGLWQQVADELPEDVESVDT